MRHGDEAPGARRPHRTACAPASIATGSAPFERQRSYGSLRGFALVALLLVVDLRPAGMPERLRRPCDERWPEDLGTLEAPGSPGLLAAVFGHWRDPGLFLQCRRGSLPCALVTPGDQEAGRAHGPRPGARLDEGKVGMALGTLGDGGVASGEGLQGDTELGDEGLPQQRIGRDDTVIGGEGGADLMAARRWAMTSAERT